MTLNEIIRKAIESEGLTELVEGALTELVEHITRQDSFREMLKGTVSYEVWQKESEVAEAILDAVSTLVGSEVERQLDTTPF